MLPLGVMVEDIPPGFLRCLFFAIIQLHSDFLHAVIDRILFHGLEAGAVDHFDRNFMNAGRSSYGIDRIIGSSNSSNLTLR